MLATTVVQAALACTLSFLGGATFSLNVFTAVVEREAVSKPALSGIWAPACGAIFYLSSLLMIPCAVHLSHMRSRARGERTMLLSSAVAFLVLACAGPGVRYGLPVVVIVSVAAVGVPLGVFALLTVEHLSVWCPHFFGRAVGISTVAFGSGTILAASVFHCLLDAMSFSGAIILTSMIFAALSLAATVLIRFPGEAGHSAPVPASAFDHHAVAEGVQIHNNLFETPKLTSRTLLQTRQFMSYALIVLASCAPFPIIPYFFILAEEHDASEEEGLNVYQLGTAISIVFNLASATLCDLFRTRTGVWSIGVRNVLLCVKTLQTGGFIVLTLLDSEDRFGLWAVIATVQRLFYLAGFGFAALMAGDIFGHHNAALVLGVGGGLALGVGEALAASLMFAVDMLAPGRGSVGHFQFYYAVSALWSLLGLFALIPLRRM